MDSKHMKRRILLNPGEHEYELKSPVELEYYLVESDIDENDGLTGKRGYGIEIVKREMPDRSAERIERRFVRNISCNEQNTARILEKLANNLVTPVGLPFVLDDMIGV